MTNLHGEPDIMFGYQVISGSVLAVHLIIKWFLITLTVNFGLFFIWITWRFLSLTFGQRIRPNGNLGIIITGATSGFGLALAKLFYKLGFTVVATYFNDKEPGYKELQELGSESVDSTEGSNFKRPYIFLVHMDVRSPESIISSGEKIDSLLDEHDIKLHSLINNAGIAQSCPFELSCRESIMNMINTNLTGTMLVTRQFLLRIIQNKGRIINVSSGTHVFPAGANNIYGTTKAAVVHFSQALHDGIRRYGASSHCAMPGNLVTVSNILYSSIQGMQKTCSNLTTQEKEAYSKTIDIYRNVMIGLLKTKLKKSGDNLEQMAKVYNFEVPEIDKAKHTRNKKSKGFFLEIFHRIVNADKSTTLEESGSLVAYEQVICLVRPPVRIYPGDFFYTYIIGPLLEFCPTIIHDFTAKYVIANLYN